jgi:hypothetical protein
LKGKIPLFIGVSEDFGVSVEKNEKMLQKKQKNVEEQAARRGGTGSSKASNRKLAGCES